MNTREWALLTFTVLTQLSTGTLFFLMIVRGYLNGKLGVEKTDALTDKPTYTILPVMILALLASLLHLGKLGHIVGAVPNLGTSWLSREVVFSVAFVILVGIYTFMEWRKTGSPAVRSLFGWLSALTGLVLIYCMGKVYMLPAQPAWNTFATPLTFFTTALLLGALGTATALMLYAGGSVQEASPQEPLRVVMQSLAVVTIVLLGVEFLVIPAYLAYLGALGGAALQTLSMMAGQFAFTLFLRLALVFLGAGVLTFYLYRKVSTAGKEQTIASLTYAAFVLVLIGEALGRFLFYASHYRIGV